MPPVWPPVPGTQQMQQHLDIQVDDLAAASAVAEEAGAVAARRARGPTTRSCGSTRDPAGHPFCLFVPRY